MLAFVAPLFLGSLRSAEASCGDWLVGHDMASHATVVENGSAGDPTAKPADLPPRRRPCNGPSCGRAPFTPLAPSDAPTVPIELDRAVLLSDLAPVEISACAWLVLDEPLLIPAVSGPPERPPRVG